MMPNRFPLVPSLRRSVPRPAGASMVEAPSWLRMLNAQRVYVMSQRYPQRPGESAAAYGARIRMLVAAYTTDSIARMRPSGAVSAFSAAKNRALRAAGDAGKEPGKLAYLAALPGASNFNSAKMVRSAGAPTTIWNEQKYAALGAMRRPMKPAGDAFDDLVNNLETGGAYGAANPAAIDANGNPMPTSPTPATTTTPTSGGGLSDAQITALAGDVSSILGQAATVVSGVLRGQDAVHIAQIQSDAAIRIQELRNQAAATSNPAQQTAIANQIAALQAALAQIAAANNTGMSTGTMVALGVGAVALVGLAIMSMRPRHNPVIYRRSKSGHGHLEPYKYVSARKLRRSR